jgi:hypothetical protein
MWKQVTPTNIPDDLAAHTHEVWEYSGVMQIGIMRQGFLCPPYVWGVPLSGGVVNVRKAPELVDEFQRQTHLPVIYAEVETHAQRNQALVRFLGFEEIERGTERNLYRRSI